MPAMLASRRLLFACALAAFVAAASPALADPSLSDRETARSLMDDGDAKRDKGDLKGALKSYEAADAIMHVPTTGLEVARAQAQLGLLLEARETLNHVMRLPPKPGEPQPFVAARKSAESLSTELAARIPSVTVNLTNVEPGQTPVIVFDGEAVPPAASAAPRKVNPGRHSVVARSGSLEKKVDVDVAERDSKVVTIDLKPVTTEPAKRDETPPSSSGPSALPKVLMYGGFGLAAVGLGVGAITGVLSISKVSDVKKDCPNNICPAGRQSDIDSAKSLGTISTIGFIVGGVGVATGVIGIVLQNKQGHSEAAPAGASAKLTVHPDLGPTWAGLHGTF
jgi:hypothetical protein